MYLAVHHAENITIECGPSYTAMPTHFNQTSSFKLSGIPSTSVPSASTKETETTGATEDLLKTTVAPEATATPSSQGISTQPATSASTTRTSSAGTDAWTVINEPSTIETIETQTKSEQSHHLTKLSTKAAMVTLALQRTTHDITEVTEGGLVRNPSDPRDQSNMVSGDNEGKETATSPTEEVTRLGTSTTNISGW